MGQCSDEDSVIAFAAHDTCSQRGSYAFSHGLNFSCQCAAKSSASAEGELIFRLFKPGLFRGFTGSWNPGHLVPTPVDPPTNLTGTGLYLHVPFCRSLCPFCPYNRQLYTTSEFEIFERAVYREIDRYAESTQQCGIISLYVGGGTPTLNHKGFLRILRYIRARFPGNYPVAVELHPHVADPQALKELLEAGVSQVSLGVQSLDDRDLQRIGRNHNATAGRTALRYALATGFNGVNVDLIIAVPGQTDDSWYRTVTGALDIGADEISTYPMLFFPYTQVGQRDNIPRRPPEKVLHRRLDLVRRAAEQKGLERSSVWTWARPTKAHFSSVTRNRYIGLGPGAASMTGDRFYVNTFSVAAYADSVRSRLPVALVLQVPPRLDRAYWLYWSLYSLHISREEFAHFYPGFDLDQEFGNLLRTMSFFGLLHHVPAGYDVTDSGAYWIHRLQNAYSLYYLEHVWGACRREAWPLDVTL
jgi:coproporphyrinogen III oxidase-like Fe-S oxidoreductase